MIAKARTSVIIPVYNGQKYIADALGTVARQTRPVKEIVIVDDGSKPRLEVPKSFSNLPILLIRTENRGLGAARQLAATYCSGEYLALLDCDDLWHPDKIALQEQMLDANPRAVLCYSSVTYFPDPAIRPAPKFPFNIRKEQLRELWRRNFILPSSVLVRRSAWFRAGGSDPNLSGVADWELWWRLAHLGPFVFIPRPVTFYRLHQEQMTKNLYNMLREEVVAKLLMARRAYRLLRRIGLSSGERTRQLDATRHFLYDYIIYYQQSSRNAYDIAFALWKHVNDPKAWVLFLRSLIPGALVCKLRELRTLLRGRAAKS